MVRKNLNLSLFDRILILFYNRILLIGLFLILPLIMYSLMDDMVLDTQNQATLIQTAIGVIIILAGFYNSIKRIELLENYQLMLANVVGEIVNPLKRDRRFILRLTLSLTIDNRNVVRHFYYKRRPIIHSQLNYQVIVNPDYPDKYILLNSLPKKVRKLVESC